MPRVQRSSRSCRSRGRDWAKRSTTGSHAGRRHDLKYPPPCGEGRRASLRARRGGGPGEITFTPPRWLRTSFVAIDPPRQGEGKKFYAGRRDDEQDVEVLLMRYAARMKCRFLLSMIFLVALGANASAEVEKFMQLGDGQLRPYFRLKFTPPEGWVQDAKASQENGVPIYVPKGTTFGDAPALIYIRVSYNSDKRSMDKFIEV